MIQGRLISVNEKEEEQISVSINTIPNQPITNKTQVDETNIF